MATSGIHRSSEKRRLLVVCIRPSKYDDDNCALRHVRGGRPSGGLACLESLTQAVANSEASGPDFHIRVGICGYAVQGVALPIDTHVGCPFNSAFSMVFNIQKRETRYRPAQNVLQQTTNTGFEYASDIA